MVDESDRDSDWPLSRALHPTCSLIGTCLAPLNFTCTEQLIRDTAWFSTNFKEASINLFSLDRLISHMPV